MDAARRTTSLMRKGTFPAIAGNPAAGSQPFGMNGMMVTVDTNVMNEPRVPRIPNFLFQNPRNKSAAISHSETPKNQLAPRTPKAGYIQKMRGPLLMYGISTWASYSNHF